MALANLEARFIVELLGVAFVGYWGINASEDTIVRAILGIGAIAVFAVVWGVLLAPNAHSGLTQPQKEVLGTLVLLLSAVALAAAGQPIVAAAYAVAVVVNVAFLLLLGDDVARRLTSFGPRA